MISVASQQLSVYICQSTVVSLQLSVYKQNNLFKWRTYCIFQHIELSEPLDNKTKLLTEIQNQIFFFIYNNLNNELIIELTLKSL